MNVCVIGAGYVGLVTGTIFADLGNDVICVDKDVAKIAKLKKGISPIYEPGLGEMISRNLRDGRLSFTTKTSMAVKRSEIIFIAVGTPAKNNGETNLSYVKQAAKDIAQSIDSYKIIVNKSTVPVGTGDLVREIVESNKRGDFEFDVVSNPEFLKEGSAISDSLRPDRIVIGVPHKQVAIALLELYAPLERPMLITDVESAEIIKYASNAFLATKISFINMIADLCEKTGANVTQVIKGMGYDSRIGSAFLNAGLGFGGSCFPKDTLSLLHTMKKFQETPSLLKSVMSINAQRIPRFVNRIRKVLLSLKGKTVGVLGLAFKPNTDDMRDARSLEVIQQLIEGGARVKAFDPIAMPNAKKLLPKGVVLCKDAYKTAQGCDALIIVTEWNEFKLLNLEKLKANLKTPIIFDGRNIYAPDRMKKLGFEYYSIGRV